MFRSDLLDSACSWCRDRLLAVFGLLQQTRDHCGRLVDDVLGFAGTS